MKGNRSRKPLASSRNGIGLRGCVAYLDFDNTVTPFDVFDDIVRRFSIDRGWVAYEEAWKAGRIGSKECLEGQLRSVRVTKKRLIQHLAAIKLDAHFRPLISLLKRDGVRPVIVSDSFSFIIQHILKKNGVRGISVYSNRVRFCKDRLIPSFPRTSCKCARCAHCKKESMSAHGSDGSMTIYVGDGLSDICPAEGADLVFAKGSLLNHFRRTKREHVPFRDLGDIYRYMKECSIYESKSKTKDRQ